MKFGSLGLKLLFLIVIVGGFLRIYNISNSPPSLNWDEAAWGYNAYSVMKTGEDEYGKRLPIFTRSFDEYKSTLPMYLMVPTIKMFGLNEFGVRLPSAVLGTLSIILIYLLSKEIFASDKVAVSASFIFAIEPWAVHLSRVYYDASEALFFLLLGFTLFLRAKVKSAFLPASVMAFMISMYTYNSNKILVPIFMAILLYFGRDWIKKISKNILYTAAVILTLFVVPFAYFAIVGQAFARISSTNIFVLWPNLMSPRIYYFVWELVGRYISYFSPYNLFLREPLEPSTVVAGNSLFYPFEFIFLLVGFFYLIKNFKKYKFIGALMLISPLPAIFTWNWFQPGRTLTVFAIFSILIGFGLARVLRGRVSYLLFTLFSLVSAFYLFDSINVFSPYRDAGNYQPGFRETVPAVMEVADNFDQVIIDTPQAQPYIFYLFYGKYDPVKYHSELDLNYIGTPRKHFDFGKFKFRKIDWESDKSLNNTLLVVDAGAISDDEIMQDKYAKIVDSVNGRYGIISELISVNEK